MAKNNMGLILMIVLFLVVLYFMFNSFESFYIPPNIVRAGDGYQDPGAIVDNGFETDIDDYVEGY